ncbi:MAG: transposase [Phycisphaerales bacterium]|nr:transposase [Phycisphaerales bacterium]
MGDGAFGGGESPGPACPGFEARKGTIQNYALAGTEDVQTIPLCALREGQYTAVIMAKPWNDWYHCNGNTYGTWLQGDPRGFRERHHRRHVDGDYKNPPPPGTYDALYAKSVRQLKQRPVRLDKTQRRVAVDAMAEKLLRDGIEVIAAAVDDHHFHLLVRCPDHHPRHWVGRAKKHASHRLSEQGLVGQVWGKGCRALPITDRKHQVNVFGYVERHVREGAAVWTFRGGGRS